MAKLKPGKYVIVPGDPGRSEMIRRLKLNEPNGRIPCQHVPLSGDEISILARWNKQGAHWATTGLFALMVYTRNQEDKLQLVS